MRYITLSPEEKIMLEEVLRNHTFHHVRDRAKAMLLSNEKIEVKTIASYFHVRTRTIYSWLDRWIKWGYLGLKIKKGRGCKPKLKMIDSVVEVVKKKALIYARSLGKMAKSLGEELGFEISTHILRKFLKKLGYTWKRLRKSLKSNQNEVDYDIKLSELKHLLKMYNEGYIDLYFGDESSFNTEGYVPYGWQPRGKYIEITPAKSKSINVFGLMSAQNDLEAYSFTGTSNSKMIISLIDDFCKEIKKDTVIVLDNAPIHKSMEFKEKINDWDTQGLKIFFLPKYSPHLNLIEVLWRMMKYKWIEYENIHNFEQLNETVNEILSNFGSKYTINFKEHKKEVSNIFF